MSEKEKNEYKRAIIQMIKQMDNADYLFKVYHYLLAKYRREKGGA